MKNIEDIKKREEVPAHLRPKWDEFQEVKKQNEIDKTEFKKVFYHEPSRKFLVKMYAELILTSTNLMTGNSQTFMNIGQTVGAEYIKAEVANLGRQAVELFNGELHDYNNRRKH